MKSKRTVVFGLLGIRMDASPRGNRWEWWRPTVSIFRHEEFLVDRLELLHDDKHHDLAAEVSGDIWAVSPETDVSPHVVNFRDPWDFEEVYGTLLDFMRAYPFDTDREDYLLHMTTGTHVAQICMFLLSESHYFPGKLLQTSPPKRTRDGTPGAYTVIDLDLSRYDRIARRFAQEAQDDASFLKSGIATRNTAFNRLIDQIEQVAIRSAAPLLLTGPTGAGKSLLARRIYELKKNHHKVEGDFVEVNCATLRGDAAMSALFGHVKGAFTGALNARGGLLRAADGGILFLDEVGELGLDEQAMLLRAIEEGVFLPVGADTEATSTFQLICGTNRDLRQAVRTGAFREDLLARIDLWTFALPGLRDRTEDIEPNLDYELDQIARATGTRVTFNAEAHRQFLRFAVSPPARWTASFRDLNGAVVRMATFAPGGRITTEIVDDEIVRLQAAWSDGHDATHTDGGSDTLDRLVTPGRQAALDRFDRVQLADVLAVCLKSRTLSQAGRQLFAASRARRTRPNDADRLRKYLLRFGLSWQNVCDLERS